LGLAAAVVPDSRKEFPLLAELRGTDLCFFSWSFEMPRASRMSAGTTRRKTDTSIPEVSPMDIPKPAKARVRAIRT
jgi:hypothetical protein